MSVKESSNVIRDKVVVYLNDDTWVAHSITMDQIGTGSTSGDALRSLINNIHILLAYARKNPDVEIFREAPDRVKEISKKRFKYPILSR